MSPGITRQRSRDFGHVIMARPSSPRRLMRGAAVFACLTALAAARGEAPVFGRTAADQPDDRVAHTVHCVAFPTLVAGVNSASRRMVKYWMVDVNQRFWRLCLLYVIVYVRTDMVSLYPFRTCSNFELQCELDFQVFCCVGTLNGDGFVFPIVASLATFFTFNVDIFILVQC